MPTKSKAASSMEEPQIDAAEEPKKKRRRRSKKHHEAKEELPETQAEPAEELPETQAAELPQTKQTGTASASSKPDQEVEAADDDDDDDDDENGNEDDDDNRPLANTGKNKILLDENQKAMAAELQAISNFGRLTATGEGFKKSHGFFGDFAPSGLVAHCHKLSSMGSQRRREAPRRFQEIMWGSLGAP